VLALHRARQSFIKARTAQANQVRGLLGEFGLIVPQGIASLAKRVPMLIEDASNELPGLFRLLVERLMAHLKELDRQVVELEARIKVWHGENESSRRLAKVPGIGPITASALVATIGDAKSFVNARQLAAWMGLVPKQNSSGGKNVLLGISKRGDTYLRTLLIHGARSAILATKRRAGVDTDNWLSRLLQRRSHNVAAVALANKNARLVWALLARDREFRPDYAPA
jgi:transposase